MTRMLTFAMFAALTLPGFGQQASITLKNADVGLCNKRNADWTITKTADLTTVKPGDTVTWTVSAIKSATLSRQTLCAAGVVVVSNSGSAPATIGNIVINLQQQKGAPPTWISAAADVANATQNDSATSANIVASASQEDPALNFSFNGPKNYSVSGSQGKFSETPGVSADLNLTDSEGNTFFALSNPPTIPVGGSVTLYFTANFNLVIPEGTPLRTEVIVTFGNAGGRGGSGASASNIDIDGNGTLEANVRSVPSRKTRNVPLLVICNDEVTISDVTTATPGASFSSPTQFVSEVLTSSKTHTIPTTLMGDGTVTNTATLTGQSTKVSVITDPLLGTIKEFSCCEGISVSANSSVAVKPADVPPPPYYCTYSQGGFGSPGTPYNILNDNFPVKFPFGVEVGTPGAAGNSMLFTAATNVQAYLPASGQAGKLTADIINPITTSSGVLGGQALTLKINIALNPGFGDLKLIGLVAPYDVFNGDTVHAVLAKAENAIGGGSITNYSFGALNYMLDKLNTQAYHQCVIGPFAQHLNP